MIRNKAKSLFVACLLAAMGGLQPAFARILYPHAVLGGGTGENEISYRTVVQVSNRMNYDYRANLYLYGTGTATQWPGSWRAEYVSGSGEHKRLDMTGQDGFSFRVYSYGSFVITLVGDAHLRIGHIAISSVRGISAEEALSVSVMFQAIQDGEIIDSVGVQGGDTTAALGKAFAVKSVNKLFRIPVTKGRLHNTGIAWVYDAQYGRSTPSIDSILIELKLHGKNGFPLAVKSISNEILKPPRDAESGIHSFNYYHSAQFIDQIFSEVGDGEHDYAHDFSVADDFTGTVTVRVRDGHCYVMALRVDMRSNGSAQLTSIPAVGEPNWD